MSLLDIDKTVNELAELDYLLYDNFVDYLSKHVPKKLWDHSIHSILESYNENQAWQAVRNWSAVNYIKFTLPTQLGIQEVQYDENVIFGAPTTKEHLCIHITPTDDGLVNIEFPKYIYCTFPILISPGEHVPKTILKLFEPVKDKLEIIEGCLEIIE